MEGESLKPGGPGRGFGGKKCLITGDDGKIGFGRHGDRFSWETGGGGGILRPFGEVDQKIWGVGEALTTDLVRPCAVARLRALGAAMGSLRA